ncbi:hypothetical protein CsatA_023723 [Cannabis sativa]
MGETDRDGSIFSLHLIQIHHLMGFPGLNVIILKCKMETKILSEKFLKYLCYATARLANLKVSDLVKTKVVSGRVLGGKSVVTV